MVGILTNEGFEVGEREVTRIRTRKGWLLRTNGGYPLQPALLAAAQGARTQSTERDGDDEEGDENEDEDEDDGDDHDDDESSNDGDDNDIDQGTMNEDPSTQFSYGTDISPAEAQVQQEALAIRMAQREHRKRLLAVESHERWMTKKRRRHTRPYAGLPADPPAPPRFPSETTLTEAKEILQLDRNAYRLVRAKFHSICVDASVYKKTLVGPERWEALKDQLVRESMHLRAVMWDPADIDRKKLAIEIIACDVTKRIRVTANGITVSEAKTILGLNPEQGRIIRAQLYNIMAEEKFTTKFDEGVEYFEALKQRWIAGSEVLSAIVASGGTDPDYQRKMKAINHLCRDATRRYHDDVFRLGKDPTAPPPVKEKATTPKPKVTKRATAPSQKRAAQSTPVPVPAPVSAAAPTPAATLASPSQPRRRGRPPGSRNKKPLPHTESRLVLADVEEPPAGQEMMDAQLGSNMLLTSETQNPFVDDQYVQGYAAAQQAQSYQPPPAPSNAAIAVFFRLDAASVAMFPGTPRQWISPLTSRTMVELRSRAVQKCPGAVCSSIEGVIKDGNGGELPLPVSDETELETYLQHVQGNGAPMFNVRLVNGGQEWTV